MNKYIKLAIEEARKGILNGDGGPFGAVIVKDGVIVGKGQTRLYLVMTQPVTEKLTLLGMRVRTLKILTFLNARFIQRANLVQCVCVR